jgi:hypothetical protein
MAEQGVSMLHRGLGAFIDRIPIWLLLSQEDDIVDQLYNKVYRTAIEDAVMHPENIDQRTTFYGSGTIWNVLQTVSPISANVPSLSPR